jgi:hypothetical protein
LQEEEELPPDVGDEDLRVDVKSDEKEKAEHIF